MFYALALLISTLVSAQARPVNITIDIRKDHLINYNQQWRAVSAGSHSDIHPQPEWGRSYNGTLHAAASDGYSELQIVFERACLSHLAHPNESDKQGGSGIYVFLTLDNGGTTNLTFSLDYSSNTVSYIFFHTLGTDIAEGYYTYRELVFSRGNLTHGPHHVLIQAHNGSAQSQGDKRPSRSYPLFDYVIYTRESEHGLRAPDGGAAPARARRRALQADSILVSSCVIAGGAALLLAATAGYLFRRRRASPVAAAPHSPIALTPYPIPPSSLPAPRAIDIEPPAAFRIWYKKLSTLGARAPAASVEAQQASAAVERLQAELERVLEENEILRQAAEPPPGYSDGARSEHA